MDSTLSSGSALPTLTADTKYFPEGKGIGDRFTFIDFLPGHRKVGGICNGSIGYQVEYETFRTLVDRANEWLRANPKFQLKKCESVKFPTKGYHVNNDKMVYFESGDLSMRYVRGLRLWLEEKNEEEKNEKEKCQQIGYINLIPQQLEKGGIFNLPTYETLDDVVRRFNLMIRTNPLPGCIITVESLPMQTSHPKEDPDQSSWLETSSRGRIYLFVIRIFFELSDGRIPEEIGIVDSVPGAISEGALFTLPKYELFSAAVEKASNWWTNQHGMKICNVQTLKINIKRDLVADTQNMMYTESGSMNTYYLRILRIAYIKTNNSFEEESSSKFNVKKITCKTITPFPTKRSIFLHEYETLQETKKRISAWVKATGVQVISAETTVMRMYKGGEEHGPETSITYNTAEREENWIVFFRLYINGDYHEPPFEMLPSVPEIEHRNCILL